MKFLTFRFTKMLVVLFVFAFMNVKATAQQPAVSWNEIVHPPAYLNTLIASGSNLVAGTEAGIYVSTNEGQSWTASNNGLPENIKIRALVRVSNTILAATDKGVWSSVNEAQSWSDANGGILQNQSVLTLFVHGAYIFASTEGNTGVGINNGRIYRTINQGQNWNEATTGLPENTGTANFAAIANTIFLLDGGLYNSTNNGNTWSSTNLPSDSSSIQQIETSGSVIFAIGTRKVDSDIFAKDFGFWTSSDNGNTWKPSTTLSGGQGDFGNLTISGNNVFFIFTFLSKSSPAVVVSGYWRTTDAGKSYSQIGPGGSGCSLGLPCVFRYRKMLLTDGREYVTTNTSKLYQSNKFLVPAVTTVSAANYQVTPFSNEGIVSLFGSGLALTTAAATSVPLPISLENTSVTITDSAGIEKPAPLFYISPTQINFQIPAGLANGVGTVTVNLYNQIVASGMISIANTAPGLFTVNQTGEGFAAANVQRVKPDGTTIYQPTVQYNSTTNKFVGIPINVSSSDSVYLNLYGTGIRGRSDLVNVKATAGGVDVPVVYAGAHGSFVGVDQINVLLPPTLAGKGEVDIILSVDNQVANTVKIFIQ